MRAIASRHGIQIFDIDADHGLRFKTRDPVNLPMLTALLSEFGPRDMQMRANGYACEYEEPEPHWCEQCRCMHTPATWGKHVEGTYWLSVLLTEPH